MSPTDAICCLRGRICSHRVGLLASWARPTPGSAAVGGLSFCTETGLSTNPKLSGAQRSNNL